MPELAYETPISNQYDPPFKLSSAVPDSDDPFEPLAEGETDFQPSSFLAATSRPLPTSPAPRTAPSPHPATTSLTGEADQPSKAETDALLQSALDQLRASSTKLEIEEGSQHKSADNKAPSLTFTSPKAVNRSTSVEVT